MKHQKKLKERDLIALTEFVNSDYSEEDKNEFIEEAADGIYFPEEDITPLEWLKQVTEQIKKQLKQHSQKKSPFLRRASFINFKFTSSFAFVFSP